MSSNGTGSLTKNQSMVFDTLNRAEGPLSAYDILDKLRDDGLRAPPQVYRALDKLVSLGMVHRLESLNAFIACSHDHPADQENATMAFAICDTCNGVTEFSNSEVVDQLRDWTRAESAVLKKATIELTITCGNCRT